MDPNANMVEQESLILRGMENSPRMHALRNALAEWLAAGGFAPAWANYPKAAAYWGEA